MTTSSARFSTQSGTVSRTRTPVVDAITSFSDSMCWMFTAVMTLMPASSEREDVLVPLLVRRARRIRVRELVDDGDLRAPRQDRVDVHLLQRHAAVLDLPQRHLLEVADLRERVGAAVRLDEADDHVEALALQLVGVLEHLVGLADPRARRRCTPAAARAPLPWRARAATPRRPVGRQPCARFISSS